MYMDPTSYFVCVCVCVFWSSAAAVVIQQRWRACRQKWGNARNLFSRDSRDAEAKTETTSVAQNQAAATVIQVKLKNHALVLSLRHSAVISVSKIRLLLLLLLQPSSPPRNVFFVVHAF